MKLVSIGLPIKNEKKNIKKVLLNLVKQNFYNKEIIISDNNSTDGSDKICLAFAKKYKYIKYFRHRKDIDMFKNFFFTFKKAKGKYFMWAAADDIRSINFIKANYLFLEKNLNYIASTGVSLLDIKKFKNKVINFSLSGSLCTRIHLFFKNKWISHGIFYSLIRSKILKRFPYKNYNNYFGRDWVVNLFLVKQGNINRSLNSFCRFGSSGLSFKKNTLVIQRSNNKKIYNIEKYIPFYLFNLHSIRIFKRSEVYIRIFLYYQLFIMNTFYSYKYFFFNKNKKIY
jgi:glycosyltransferase involved in cell wall biosynthesis